MALGGRVLGIGENAKHSLDTLVHRALFGEHHGTGKFHAFAVFGSHMVFEELGSKLQGIGALVFAHVAFREEHRRLGTFVLAEVLGFGKLLERGYSLGALAFTDKSLRLRDIVLGKKRRCKRTH